MAADANFLAAVLADAGATPLLLHREPEALPHLPLGADTKVDSGGHSSSSASTLKLKLSV